MTNESGGSSPHFGAKSNNDWLRNGPEDSEMPGYTEQSSVFGDDAVPDELDVADTPRERTPFDLAPQNPFEGVSEEPEKRESITQPTRKGRGSKKKAESGARRLLLGKKGDADKGSKGAKKTKGASADGADSDEVKGKKKHSGVLGFFLNPAEDKGKKRGRGRGRNGLSYTRHNSMPLYIVGLLLATTLLSMLALGVAASKASTSQIQPAVNEAVKESGKDFPKGPAVQWAGQVLRVWGTWDEDNQGGHQTYLAPYLSAGMDDQGGWNGKGKQQVEFASLNPDPEVTDEHHATVTGSYQIQDGSWHCVAIPVYAYHASGTSGPSQWAFALASNPAPAPCAPRTGVPSSDNFGQGKNVTEDDQVNQDLQTNFFPGFMAAWGASDTNQMGQYAVPGVQMSGLGGAVATSPQPTISDVHLFYTGDSVQQNKTYKAVVTVNWTLDGSTSAVKSTYIVPLKKTGDRWYATAEPQAVPQSDDAQGGDPADVKQPGQQATPGGYPSSQTSPSSAPSSVKPGQGSSSSSPSSSKKK